MKHQSRALSLRAAAKSHWTASMIHAVARTYNTREAFKRGALWAYKQAKTFHMLDGLFGPDTRKTVWTHALVKAAAHQYGEAQSFARNAPKAYEYAVRHGLLGDLFGIETPSIVWTKDLVVAVSKSYSSAETFMQGNPSAYGYASSLGQDFLDECFPESRMDKHNMSKNLKRENIQPI